MTETDGGLLFSNRDENFNEYYVSCFSFTDILLMKQFKVSLYYHSGTTDKNIS